MPDSPTIFDGPEIADMFERLGISHVIWIPDSTTGQWETALANNAAFRLLRICREGEAWPLAAGLWLGGQRPIVIMQSTGLYESGDALRNVLKDLQIPLLAMIGARNWLVETSRDSAKSYLMPLLQAWSIEYRLIEQRGQQAEVTAYFESAQRGQRPGFVVLAEGKG